MPLDLTTTLAVRDLTTETKKAILLRLLSENLITLDELAILLDVTVVNINVEKMEMSSGAKIVFGDDNEHTNYR